MLYYKLTPYTTFYVHVNSLYIVQQVNNIECLVASVADTAFTCHSAAFTSSTCTSDVITIRRYASVSTLTDAAHPAYDNKCTCSMRSM